MKWNPLDPALNFAIEHAAIGFGYLVAIYVVLLHIGLFWFLLALAIFVTVIVTKETYWDPRHEKNPPQPFLWMGARDLFFYAVGLLLAAPIVLFH
ncbi:MAG: hypothetical protein KGJ23_08405 [Euryarchaeota archaeon]|nr:hypothetical protein [Euryarchaeota archaeon]MDE1836624.1 hypothetical protein [Euryarchaeota archaeon]MDE1879181.1 hypothetical protein [Euryarchaeota archaeon]MDE2044594.1 hypothetical protein [Thermoplasmata archaeon]